MGIRPDATWLPAIALVMGACGGGGGGGDRDASATDVRVEHALVDRTEAATPGMDSGRDAGKDSAPGPGKDSAADADTGIPPLVCSGEASEPNDTQVTATPLPGIDDCDSSGSSLGAVSSGTGDTDWMHYFGTDTTGCSVDPTVQIDAPGLRVCVFIICPMGITTISGCTNGSPASSPAETPGCCTTSTAPMTVQMNCAFTDDSADVYIRVDQPSENQCVAYNVDYHF